MNPTGAGPPDPSEYLASLGESGEKINRRPWDFLQDAGAFAPALAGDLDAALTEASGAPRCPRIPAGERGLGKAEPGQGGRKGTRLSRKELEQKLRPRGHSQPQLLQLLRLPVPAPESVPEDAPS